MQFSVYKYIYIGAFVSLSSLAALPDPAGPADFIAYARTGNASLTSAGMRAEALRERVAQVRALPDPELMYGNYVQRMDVRQSVGVTQAFPFPGTLARRGAIAEAEARSGTHDAEALWRVIEEEIVRAYADLVLTAESMRILEDNIAILGRVEDVIEARIGAGGGRGASLIRAEIARVRLEDEYASLEARLPALAARMNRLLGRPADEDLPQLRPLADLKNLAVAGGITRPGALGEHPGLMSLEQAIEGRRHAAELSRREGRPSFALGAEWMDTVAGKRDEVRVTVGVRLPIWRERYRSSDREARAERRSLEAEQRDLRFRLESELREAEANVLDAQRRAILYEQRLLPRAREGLNAEEAAYRSGRSDLLDLLEAQRVLLDLELGLFSALADALRAQAALTRILGNS